jgi:hypothetical protein
MILQQINRTDAEKVFISVNNSTSTQLSAGYLVVFNVRNVASANGSDIETPCTSGLPAFAGVVNNTTLATGYAIGSQGSTAGTVGLVQVYGYSIAYVSCSGGEGYAPGQVIGPIDGQVFGSSNGQSTKLGPIIVLSQASIAQKVPYPVFVRAL